MFSGEDDMTYMTGMDENRRTKQDFQNMHNTLVMRKCVEKSEFLDINVKIYESLGSILFTDENTFPADTRIWISVWCKKFVLICHMEHLST